MKTNNWVPVILAIAVFLPGCASSGTRTTRQTSVAQGVDQSKAYLLLQDIEPKAKRPQRGAPIDELSERAARQIKKADRHIKDARYTEAAIELERALRYDPNHPDIHRALASLHWEAGNVVRAKSHATRTLEGRPDDAAAHYLLGRASLAADDQEAALFALRSATLCPDFGNDPMIATLNHYHLAVVLDQSGYLQASLNEYANAQTMLSAISPVDSQSELASLRQSAYRPIRSARSDVLRRLGRIAEAAEVLAPVVTHAPDDVALGCRYARLLMQAGRLDEALESARKLPLSDTTVFELVYKIHDVAGHPERIVEDLREQLVQSPDDSRLVLYLADILNRLGDRERSANELNRFLVAHPENEEVRSVFFQTLLDQGKWAQAIEVCADGIDRNPVRASTLETKLLDVSMGQAGVDALVSSDPASVSSTQAYLRGLIAKEADRLDVATHWLQDAFQRSPAFLPARVALAQLYLRLYRYDEALRVCGSDDDSIQRDARLEFVLGRVYERLDRADFAERHFQAAIQLDRSNADAMLELASLYQRTTKPQQGRRLLNVLLEEQPDHEAAREMMVALYLEQGQVDVAVEQLTELQKRAKTPLVRARCTAFLDHIRNKDLDEYRKTLMDAMETHGPDADTWLAVAQSYVDPLKNTEEKRNAIERALELNPDSEEALLALVDVSRSMLDFESAITVLDQLLLRRPNRHEWRLGYAQPRRGNSAGGRWYGLIEMQWIVLDFEAALKAVEKGLSVESLDPRYLNGYRRKKVETLRFAGRFEDALNQLERWTGDDPDDTDLALMLNSEYVRQDKAELAIPLAEKMHRDSPSRRSLSVAVRALLAAKRMDRASQHLLDWLDTDPENDGIVSLLADIQVDDEEASDGLDLVRSHLLRTIDRERLQSLLISLLIRSKQYNEASSLIDSLMDEVIMLLGGAAPLGLAEPQDVPTDEELVRLPNQPFATSRLHDRLLGLRAYQLNTLFASKEFGTAKSLVLEWLEEARVSEERFNYLNYLVICYRGEGNEEAANDALRRALVLQPGDITLNNDLAYAWIDLGVRLDEAEPMIRYALVSSPLQSSYLDTYGWLLYKKSDFDGARTWLTRANVARGGADPVIQDHLGDALWRLGEKELALETWAAALQSTKDQPERALITADEQRVIDTVQKKIDDARSGETPPIAALAQKEKSED